jgi:hypothetical protein
LNQLNIVLLDLGRSADFYGRFGVVIALPLLNAVGTPFHAAAQTREVRFTNHWGRPEPD